MKQNPLDDETFLKKWADGIAAITPFQSARITYFNSYIMLFGILAGFIVTLFYFKSIWWLSIILLAALVNTIFVQIGNYQKYKMLKTLEEMKGGNEDE